MDQDAQQDVKEWDDDYCEAVYAVIQASRAVAITQKDWRVIASQCESIRGYRDVDEICAEALIRVVQSANQPDIDLLLDTQIKVRAKKRKRMLLFSVLGVLLGVCAVISVMLVRDAQRKHFLSELAENREVLEKYVPEELAEAQSAVESRGYRAALDRLRQAIGVAIDREQTERHQAQLKREEEERKRRAAQVKKEREAREIAVLQQQIREAEAKQLAEERAARDRDEHARQEAKAQLLAENARRNQITNGLASVKSAFEKKQWKLVLDSATEVLKLDKTNREAEEYKQAAEYYLFMPFVTLIATVDGKDVPAQVILDKTYTAPVTLTLIHGGVYQVMFMYTQGGRSFNAQLRLPVTAEWKGERTVRVALFEVL
jgi:hypothetical protein